MRMNNDGSFMFCALSVSHSENQSLNLIRITCRLVSKMKLLIMHHTVKPSISPVIFQGLKSRVNYMTFKDSFLVCKFYFRVLTSVMFANNCYENTVFRDGRGKKW